MAEPSGYLTATQRLDVNEARLAQLEAALQSMLRVRGIAGKSANWHAVAQGMYDAGESIKQIAAVTGQQYNTVEVMLRRYRKAKPSLSVVGGTE